MLRISQQTSEPTFGYPLINPDLNNASLIFCASKNSSDAVPSFSFNSWRAYWKTCGTASALLLALYATAATKYHGFRRAATQQEGKVLITRTQNDRCGPSCSTWWRIEGLEIRQKVRGYQCSHGTLSKNWGGMWARRRVFSFWAYLWEPCDREGAGKYVISGNQRFWRHRHFHCGGTTTSWPIQVNSDTIMNSI